MHILSAIKNIAIPDWSPTTDYTYGIVSTDPLKRSPGLGTPLELASPLVNELQFDPHLPEKDLRALLTFAAHEAASPTYIHSVLGETRPVSPNIISYSISKNSVLNRLKNADLNDYKQLRSILAEKPVNPAEFVRHETVAKRLFSEFIPEDVAALKRLSSNLKDKYPEMTISYGVANPEGLDLPVSVDINKGKLNASIYSDLAPYRFIPGVATTEVYGKYPWLKTVRKMGAAAPAIMMSAPLFYLLGSGVKDFIPGTFDDYIVEGVKNWAPELYLGSTLVHSLPNILGYTNALKNYRMSPMTKNMVKATLAGNAMKTGLGYAGLALLRHFANEQKEKSLEKKGSAGIKAISDLERFQILKNVGKNIIKHLMVSGAKETASGLGNIVLYSVPFGIAGLYEYLRDQNRQPINNPGFGGLVGRAAELRDLQYMEGY